MICHELVVTDNLQVTLPDGTPPRWAHSVTTITVCPGLESVTMFGGSTVKFRSLDKQPRISETTVITFSECICSEQMHTAIQ